MQSLYNLNQIWTQRNDTFNAVFDQQVTVWEALTRVARCGRSITFMQGGIIRIVRDSKQTIPVALFSPRNIIKNSLKIKYLMPSDDTADSVTIEYFSNKTWKPDEITSTLPNSTTEQPAKIKLFGCTDKTQATREGKYLAAANRYRRKIISFKTELEGLIPNYGDLIAINHDMPSWGQGGEIININNKTLTLSEEMNWQAKTKHYIALRKKNGSISGPWPVTKGKQNNQVVLQQELDITPYTDNQQERTHFAFGIANNWGIMARVTAINPRAEQVEISAVGENNLVHTADQ